MTVVSPSCSLSVVAAPTVSCPLSFATLNQAYSSFASATGGSQTGFVFAISGGSLPDGLSFASSGQMSGTPTTVQFVSFVVSVTDSQGASGSASCSIDVSNIQTVQCPSQVVANTMLQYAVTITSSVPPTRTFSVVASGSLPPNVTLDASSGLLSGTPTTEGAYEFSIFVTNGGVSATSPVCQINVSAFPEVFCPSNAFGEVTVAYHDSILVAGGSGILALSISSGFLPFGLVFSTSTGTISGTPLVSGSFSFQVVLWKEMICVRLFFSSLFCFRLCKIWLVLL